METPKDFTNTHTQNGITGTTEVNLRPSNPNTPDDLNIHISIRPTGEASFINTIHVQGLTEPKDLVAFFHQLAHELGHDLLDRCIKQDIVEMAVEQTAMEVMVDDAIEKIFNMEGE